MSLLRAMEVEEPVTLAVGWDDFFALETLESALLEDVPCIVDGGAGVGVVVEVLGARRTHQGDSQRLHGHAGGPTLVTLSVSTGTTEDPPQ